MKKSSASQPNQERSARSRRLILAEKSLRGNIRNLELTITKATDEILELEKRKAHLMSLQAAEPDKHLQEELSQTITKIAEASALIEAYKDGRAETELQIEKLSPSPGQAQARREQQQEFTKLAQGRLELDRKIDRVLKELRAILSERKELTAEMAKCGELLDLEIVQFEDGLDGPRVEKSLGSVPEEVSAASQRWADCFLGVREGITPYVVIEESLEVRERLLDHGIYTFGERILLPAGEAAELLREDRPVKGRKFPWEFVPPSIVTLEAWDAAVATAEEKGIPLKQVFTFIKYKCEEEARERYRVEEEARQNAVRDVFRIR